MKTKPFVLIIEDHPLYKQALLSLMRLSFPDIDVSACSSSEEAFDFLGTQSTATIDHSLVLLDLTLPGLSGLEMIDKLVSDYPRLQVVVVSGTDEVLRVGACLGAGVSAFVSKSTPPDRIVDLIGRALRERLNEQTWLTSDGPKSLDGLQRIHLTSRQVEVLGLICQGYSNKQISEKLNIIEATSKAHVSAIFKELGVVSRTQALLAAQRLGFKENGL